MIYKELSECNMIAEPGPVKESRELDKDINQCIRENVVCILLKLRQKTTVDVYTYSIVRCCSL